MDKNYGTIKLEDKTIVILDEHPVQTSRLMMDEWSARVDEWSARGHTESGVRVRVYWHFEVAREGVEANYDWDDVTSIEIDE